MNNIQTQIEQAFRTKTKHTNAAITEVLGRTDENVSGHNVAVFKTHHLSISEKDILSVNDQIGDNISVISSLGPRDKSINITYEDRHGEFLRSHVISRTYIYLLPKIFKGREIKIDKLLKCSEIMKKFENYAHFTTSLNALPLENSSKMQKFKRKIDEIEIESDEEFYKVSISSKGFLTHQIRKMIRMMQVVGSGLESPLVLEKILSGDLEEPMYNPGVDIPVASSHGLIKSDFEFMEQLQIQFDLEEIKYDSVLRQIDQKLLKLESTWNNRLLDLQSKEPETKDFQPDSYKKLENSLKSDKTTTNDLESFIAFHSDITKKFDKKELEKLKSRNQRKYALEKIKENRVKLIKNK